MNEGLRIDLGDLDVEDIDAFVQAGSRGLPDFAASTASTTVCCHPNACSCRTQEDV